MAANVMDGAGFYNEHSAQQQRAAAVGSEMLRAAAARVALAAGEPLTIADYGASQGANSLRPLAAALDEIESRPAAPGSVAVVHTDLPGNDFSSLFETVAGDPASYARPGVYSLAAGRSFYEQLLPDDSVSLGWSATAVLWLREAPCPLPGSLFSFVAEGRERAIWREAAIADWQRFLELRGAELRSGAELVVSTLIAGDGYLEWMGTVEAGAADARRAGAISQGELESMVIPTYLKEPEEYFGAVDAGRLPFELVDSAVGTAPDPAFEAYRQHGDRDRFGREAVAAIRAWSEPSLSAGLDGGRTQPERRAAMDAVYRRIGERLRDAPLGCAWKIGLARLRRLPREELG